MKKLLFMAIFMAVTVIETSAGEQTFSPAESVSFSITTKSVEFETVPSGADMPVPKSIPLPPPPPTKKCIVIPDKHCQNISAGNVGGTTIGHTKDDKND